MSLEDPNNRSPLKPVPSWSIPERPAGKRFWIIIACICTLLFHLVFIALLRCNLINFSTSVPISEKKSEIVYEIALSDPAPPRFVDTNPYLAQEEPPDTNNYAAKSQRAAQEIPAETFQKDIPTITGDMEEILKIVPDELFLRDEPIEIADASSSQASFSDVSMEVKEQKVEEEGSKVAVRRQPKPRQRVKPLVGGIRDSSSAASNVGIVAVDAKFNQFGVYRQKMNESIGYQWYLLLSNYMPSGDDLRGHVHICYTIDSTGTVIDLEVSDSSASTLLTFICKDSIMSLGSFGPWNEDMLAVLGKEQKFHVNFVVR